ncbi:4'-phosphopantetheinyl transferase superfamily protein [Listeria marthii]|uniref:4'-phosphopantetheinyl transferase family protein n=1 Tax=Listeria marthii TaxID=529731 RepID=UPI001625E4A5|nr:4'-phosphopantetheinyl transferase superfamily protein [Listeria marthii]MBC2074224.1 4'-phosphopantetheinyl transferase superfamily protein [Listeria marthii]MBF2587324.1 4'-phosphopantetheinyl transferase superfamily protein [Listeria marthii]
MLNIYYTNIIPTSYSDLLADFREIISEERKEKIQTFRSEDDKVRSLLAEILLRYSLSKDFFLQETDVQIILTTYGKPYLNNISDIHFNISHSGSYVACAVSNQVVGLDIEKIGNSNEKLIQVFHKNEIAYLNKLPSKYRRQAFYNLWSLKESYIKYLGLGLAFPLNSFYIKEEDSVLNIYREDKKIFKGKIEEVTIDSEFMCSVCYDATCITSIEKVDNKKLKNYLTNF